MIKDINLYFLSKDEKNKVLNHHKKTAIIAVLLAIFITKIMFYFGGSNRIELEKTNKKLHEKIHELSENSPEIIVLKKRIKSLEEELFFLGGLQNNRKVILDFFERLPQIVPMEIRISKIMLENHNIILGGVSASAKTINELIENLERNVSNNTHLLSFNPDKSGEFELECKLFLTPRDQRKHAKN